MFQNNTQARDLEDSWWLVICYDLRHSMKSFLILFKCLLCHDTAIIWVWILIFLYQTVSCLENVCFPFRALSCYWKQLPRQGLYFPFPPDAFLLMLTRAMGAEVTSFSGQDSRSRFTFTFYQLNSFEHKALGEDWNTREKETGSLNYSTEESYPPTQNIYPGSLTEWEISLYYVCVTYLRVNYLLHLTLP